MYIVINSFNRYPVNKLLVLSCIMFFIIIIIIITNITSTTNIKKLLPSLFYC